MRLLVRLLLVLIMVGAGRASDAHASWSYPHPVGIHAERVAGNAQGAQAFLWTVETRALVRVGAERWSASYVRARLRLSDGRLTAQQAVSPQTGRAADASAIGLDRRGNATVVWIERRPDDVSVWVSWRPADGRFDPGTEIGRAEKGITAGEVKLRVASDGAAVVAWSAGDRIDAAVRRPGTCPTGSPRACFGVTQHIAGRCPPRRTGGCLDLYLGSPKVAIGARGRAYVAWAARDRRMHRLIRLAVAPPGLGFARAQAVSPRSVATADPAIGVLTDGVVVAGTGLRRGKAPRVMAARRDRDGRAAAPSQTLSPQGCGEAIVRVNRRDETTIAWECRWRTDNRWIGAAVAPGGRPFGQPVALSDPATSDALSPVLALDASDNTIIAYSEDQNQDQPGFRVTTRIRPAGRPFGQPHVVASGLTHTIVASGSRLTLFIIPLKGRELLQSQWTP
jgi:hypothetical protein